MDVREAVAQRWSPRAYRPAEVDDAVLREIFEAGRSAQSCFNEQPWRFLFAKKNAGAPRAALEALLAEGNAYAKQAWVLGITFGKRSFTQNSKPNRHMGHDTGAASQLMALRAFDLGVNTRFMGGFSKEGAEALAPADFEAYAMFVIGFKEEGLERPERVRKPLVETVFENAWGSPAKF